MTARRRGGGSPGLARLAIAAAMLASGTAAAQSPAATYPARPIRFVVTFPTGGGLDLVARIIAQQLSDRWGQQVVVDNRPGAGGTIGTEIGARAAPDGHTFLFVSSSHAINPAIYRRLPYDSIGDFAPVSLLTAAPHLLVVHPSIAAHGVQDFIALARAKPGSIAYASGGVGSSTHLAGELLKSMAGIDLVHVPYKGTGPAVIDTLGGQVGSTISSVPSVVMHVRAGRLRALGLTAARRSLAAPEIPTIAESGVAGFEAASWHAVFAPRGTPAPIVRRAHAEITAVLGQEATRARVLREGLEPYASTPEALGAHLRVEIAKWAKVIKAAGIRGE